MDNQNNKKYHVYVEENSHYMDEESRRLHGVYDTYQEAVWECEGIVHGCLINDMYNYNEDELFRQYELYGLSPWIYPEDEGKHFQSFEYAKELIKMYYKLKPFLD